MADQSIDIAIVGGGPAGTVAGLIIARAGLSVTVVEKRSKSSTADPPAQP